MVDDGAFEGVLVVGVGADGGLGLGLGGGGVAASHGLFHVGAHVEFEGEFTIIIDFDLLHDIIVELEPLKHNH